MLKIYDYLDEVIQQETFIPEPMPVLSYSLKEIVSRLDFEEKYSFEEPLERTLKACVSLGIPIKEHFRKVYCCTNDALQLDILMSSVACYLFLINCNPNHPVVANAQVFFTHKE